MAAALKLLVVEKDIAHLEQMSQLLKQLKAEPRAINDSAEAVLMIHQEQFDGIFLDLNLPIVGGIHLARMVRESVSNQGTPIIIVTGPDQADAMHVSFSLGANYFLREPVDRQTLGSLLREIRKPSAKNRVRTSRVSLSGRVSCTLGTETLEGRAWNISQGGIVLEVTGLKLGVHGTDILRLAPNSHHYQGSWLGGVGARGAAGTVLYRDECGTSKRCPEVHPKRVEDFWSIRHQSPAHKPRRYTAVLIVVGAESDPL